MARKRTDRDIDADEMTTSALWLSASIAGSFVVFVILMSIPSTMGYALGDRLGGLIGARIGFLIGILVGGYALTMAIRRLELRIKKRRPEVWRGVWLGGFLAAAMLTFLVLFPQQHVPGYCPPGAACEPAAGNN